MDGWSLLIVVLAFISGFIFCKILDFFAASSLAVKIVKTANLTALYLFVKSFEKIIYYNNLTLNDYIKREDNERNIEVFKRNLDQEVELFKKRCISTLVEARPSIFRNVTPYHDWPSAMMYLNTNRDFVLELFKGNQND
tara:strand:+ start:8339 stop:8755 length:417 start_codon:yes stop_codon:yes gene_type:complete